MLEQYSIAKARDHFASLVRSVERESADATRDAGCTRWSLARWGSMVVSTPVLARYKIGDLIRAFEPPYFRCIGRDKWWTPLRYAWDEFRTFNLGRL